MTLPLRRMLGDCRSTYSPTIELFPIRVGSTLQFHKGSSSRLSWGLAQSHAGPCGVLAALQSWVALYILFLLPAARALESPRFQYSRDASDFSRCQSSGDRGYLPADPYTGAAEKPDEAEPTVHDDDDALPSEDVAAADTPADSHAGVPAVSADTVAVAGAPAGVGGAAGGVGQLGGANPRGEPLASNGRRRSLVICLIRVSFMFRLPALPRRRLPARRAMGSLRLLRRMPVLPTGRLPLTATDAATAACSSAVLFRSFFHPHRHPWPRPLNTVFYPVAVCVRPPSYGQCVSFFTVRPQRVAM